MPINFDPASMNVIIYLWIPAISVIKLEILFDFIVISNQVSFEISDSL